jgi:hypothetical protein
VGLILACSGVAIGCAATGVSEPLVSEDAAASAVEQALDLQLTKEASTDVPALSDLVARYRGGDRASHVVLLVFDSVASSEQVTERETAVSADLSAVRERNVVVILGGRGLTRRRAAVVDALHSVSSRG